MQKCHLFSNINIPFAETVKNKTYNKKFPQNMRKTQNWVYIIQKASDKKGLEFGENLEGNFDKF